MTSHYHIRWSNSKLDWQAFPTPDEARAQAEQLGLPSESYAIQQVDGNCPECNRLVSFGRRIAPTVDNDPRPK